MTEAEKVEAAIKMTEYKYFGDYELSDDQHEAVDTLVTFARNRIAGDVEPVAWMYELFDMREVHMQRLPERISWKETPLYAHPPAQAPTDAEARPPWYCQLPDAVHAEVIKQVREIQAFTIGYSDQMIDVMAEAVYNALVDTRALLSPRPGEEG